MSSFSCWFYHREWVLGCFSLLVSMDLKHEPTIYGALKLLVVARNLNRCSHLINEFGSIWTTTLISCSKNMEGYYCKKIDVEGYKYHLVVIKYFFLFLTFSMEYECCQRNGWPQINLDRKKNVNDKVNPNYCLVHY